MDCLFCNIIAGTIPSTKIYEDDQMYVFKDIEPIAPVHYLMIPKQHISGVSELTEKNAAVVAHIFAVAAKLAKEAGLDKGYRIITNCGDDAGQTVHHLHFHLLGGKQMGWSAESGV